MQSEENRRLILVVEDDPWTRTMESALLAGEGYAVAEAKDGDEALILIEKLHPAAVLLDVALPRVSGLEVLRRIKANPETRETSVLIVSAYSDLLGDADIGLADARISKPFEYDDIVRKVEAAVNRHLALVTS
jgi:two-component system phosphate regulon response regulator PhoB